MSLITRSVPVCSATDVTSDLVSVEPQAADGTSFFPRTSEELAADVTGHPGWHGQVVSTVTKQTRNAVIWRAASILTNQ